MTFAAMKSECILAAPRYRVTPRRKGREFLRICGPIDCLSTLWFVGQLAVDKTSGLVFHFLQFSKTSCEVLEVLVSEYVKHLFFSAPMIWCDYFLSER